MRFCRICLPFPPLILLITPNYTKGATIGCDHQGSPGVHHPVPPVPSHEETHWAPPQYKYSAVRRVGSAPDQRSPWRSGRKVTSIPEILPSPHHPFSLLASFGLSSDEAMQKSSEFKGGTPPRRPVLPRRRIRRGKKKNHQNCSLALAK